MSNVLVVFAKAPIEGQVKTRLCPPLTPAQAAKLAACFLVDTVERSCTFPETKVYIAFTPAESESVFRALLPFPVHYLPQRGDALGERELNIFLDLRQRGASRIVLIGSDIPTLPSAHIREAFTLLEDSRCDAVFNPTDDGGYCLIGMREPHSVLFESIPWSTSTVMAETLSRARQHSLTVELTPAWYDVDDHAGLSRLANDLKDTKEGTVAPRTQAMLRRLGLFPEHEPE